MPKTVPDFLEEFAVQPDPEDPRLSVTVPGIDHEGRAVETAVVTDAIDAIERLDRNQVGPPFDSPTLGHRHVVFRHFRGNKAKSSEIFLMPLFDFLFSE